MRLPGFEVDLADERYCGGCPMVACGFVDGVAVLGYGPQVVCGVGLSDGELEISQEHNGMGWLTHVHRSQACIDGSAEGKR